MSLLPLTAEAEWQRHQRSLTEYARRMLRYRHMDFDYTLWQMLYLCVDPRRIYRTTTYHSRTKHQWARDDPAFVVVQVYLLTVAVVAWSLALGHSGALEMLRLASYAVLVDFFAIGSLLATIGWWLGNTYLHERAATASSWEPEPAQKQEAVEWQYAFDVHCNAFFPLFLLLYVLQFLLLPLLLTSGTLAAVLSNTLYALALSAYHYITFLGYNELPFLRSCECFVYPIALIGAAYVCTLPFVWYAGFSCTWLVVGIYFG